MAYVRGLDSVTGQPVYLKTASGEGTQEDPFVMERADPVAADKLDTISAKLDPLSLTEHSNIGAGSNGVIKASAGKLHQFFLRNKSTTATYYLVLFNSTTAPAANASNLRFPAIPIFPGQILFSGKDIFGGAGLNFTTGIAYGISTSDSNYVAGTPADVHSWFLYA